MESLQFNSVFVPDTKTEDEEIIEEQQFYLGGGIGKSEYSHCHAIPRLSERTINPDLEKLNLPDDVRLEAERIFQQLATNTKRGKRRKKLLFYCVLNAYNTLGQPQDPKLIAELVGISPTEMTKAFSMCSQAQTSYKPLTTFRSPLDFIPSHIELVGLNSDCIPDVIKLGTEILERDSELAEHYPQVVAAGILLYYMTINGATINKKKFAETFRRSEMTINKMFKHISQIHNM